MHILTQHLLEALRSGQANAFDTGLVPATLADAETVQAELVGALGGHGAWKVSPWSPTAIMGAAPIPQAWMHRSGDRVRVHAGTRLEVEFALVLGANNTWQLAPAFELVDTRLDPASQWPDLAKRGDLLSSAGLVLGAAQALPADGVSERAVSLTLGDGTTQEVRTILDLAALMGAANWLLADAERRNLPLTDGTTIITGARIGPIALPMGETRASIEGLGTVEMWVEAE
jgi:2-keto-4-pentenoate hydratase